MATLVYESTRHAIVASMRRQAVEYLRRDSAACGVDQRRWSEIKRVKGGGAKTWRGTNKRRI